MKIPPVLAWVHNYLFVLADAVMETMKAL